jgi:transposase
VNLARASKSELAERVTALEAELAAREAALAKAYSHAATLEAERDALRAAHERLRLELELIRRRIVLGKAERVDTKQLELEFAETLAKLNALADTPATEPEPTPKGSKPASKGRRNLANAKLMVETVALDDPVLAMMVAQGRADTMGSETSRWLGYKRGGPCIIEVVRTKYVSSTRTARTPSSPLPWHRALSRACSPRHPCSRMSLRKSTRWVCHSIVSKNSLSAKANLSTAAR